MDAWNDPQPNARIKASNKIWVIYDSFPFAFSRDIRRWLEVRKDYRTGSLLY